jgi:hypothetical protein
MRALVKWRGVAAGTAAATALALGVMAPPAMAADSAGAPSTTLRVLPTLVSGNLKCEDLNPDYKELYVQGNYNTTYYFMGQPVVVTSADNKLFDWDSMPAGTFGWPVQAVIVKGGPNSNVYDYGAGEYGDTGLHAPLGASGGTDYYELSHISFCSEAPPNIGEPLAVEKTAAGTFEEETTWELTKSVEPDSFTGFVGDSFDATWTVTATPTVQDPDNYVVSGTITITNPNVSGPDVQFSVVDRLYEDPDGDPLPDSVAVDCPDYILSPEESVECTYSVDVDDDSATLNKAFVESLTPGVGNGEAEDPIEWTSNPTGDSSVTLADERVEYSEEISELTTETFDETFVCPAPSETVVYTNGKYSYEVTNTATLTGENTDLSRDATVTVDCYELAVTKDAYTSLTRTWTWDIEKVADKTDLTLAVGQEFLVNYDVTVSAMSEDSDWAVHGDAINVYNPATIPATINSVSDVITGGFTADVDCGDATFPYELEAGGTLTCSYSAELPDASSRTNTATATLQNSPSGTTDFTGSASVVFDEETVVNQVDECIDVTDSLKGFLGTACADVDELPVTFEYTYWVGPYEVCGDYTVDNTATFTTDDTETAGSDTWTIDVMVPCPGCTLTQGYWKTHSEFGPAPTDDGWYTDSTPQGPNTSFFQSGKTWYQTFRTPPAGNAYYNLAHQYMAAVLNIENGAGSTPEVDAALASAQNLFSAYTPAQVAGLKGAAKKAWTDLASILDRYNNGDIGPGHCTEDSTSE